MTYARHAGWAGFGLRVLWALLLVICPAALRADGGPSGITVVLDDAYPPYAFRDANGVLRGIQIDEWRLWQKKTGTDVTLVGTDWDKALWFMERGGADVIDTIFVTPARMKLYDFSKPYASIEVPVFFHKDIGGITDARSLLGFTVGVKAGDAAVDYLTNAGITSLEKFPTYEAVVKAAAERRIRVFCIDKPPGLYYLYKMNLEGDYRVTPPLYTGELHWAVRKGKRQLLSFVEKGFSLITPLERRDIVRRWKGTPIQRMVYYQYGAYAGYAAFGAAILLVFLLLLTWSLRRRVSARTAQLQHALDDLRQSEARFRLLAENANDVIWTMDPQGRFTYVSPSVEKLRGYTPEEVIAQPLDQALTPSSLPRVRGLMAELRRQIEQGARSFDLPPQEVEQPCKDGSIVWTEVIITPLFDDAGHFLLMLGITRDISERRRREEAQRSLEAQMLQAQKLESLGVLAGGIAHDFNNILTSILGNAELAQTDIPEGSPARGRLRDIDEASRRAADLCRQMLAYSGRGRVVVETVDLSALVGGMTHMLQVSISKKAVLQPHLPAGLPRVTADATQIRQIVMNLIINASEALGDSAGTILVTTGVMDCGRGYLAGCNPGDDCAPGRYAFIEVADTGMGMDEAMIPRIFDPFFTTKFTGRGLGLAAVLGIVRAHHGAIRVTSAPGKGTTFRLHLPLSDSAPARAAAAPPASGEWRGRGTILLVDDEETVLSVGRAMLEKLGFSVITAGDGRDAVEAFRRRPADLACVILDLTMPRMDGLETFRGLRQIDPRARIAIATGYSGQDVALRFAVDGTPAFIQKPYRMAELASILRQLLEQEV